MEPTEKILDKIKKLMKHSESANKVGNIAEAEVFAQKIQELLAKHNLSESSIDMSEEKMTDGVTEEELSFHCGSTGGDWRLQVMYALCRYNFCRCYNIKDYNKKEKMLIVGSEANIEVVKYIYSVLIKVFNKEVLKALKNQPANISRQVFKRAFLFGCASGLRDKLKEEAERFANANKSMTGLMIVNDKALSNYMEAKGSRIGNGRKQQKINDYAFSQGKEVGKNSSWSKAVKSQPINQPKQLN